MSVLNGQYYSERVPSEKYALSFNDEILDCGPYTSILPLKETMCMYTITEGKALGLNWEHNSKKFPLGATAYASIFSSEMLSSYNAWAILLNGQASHWKLLVTSTNVQHIAISLSFRMRELLSLFTNF